MFLFKKYENTKMLFTTMVVVTGCSRISTFISDWHKFYYDILKDAATPPSDGYGILSLSGLYAF